MKKVDARTGIEIIDSAECWQLLRENAVGRLAVADRDGADIFPVNYVCDGEAVVFRTAPGTKLNAVGRGRVCFEIDEFDRDEHTGWSVVVHGRLEYVDARSGPKVSRALELPVDPWASGAKPHCLRIVPGRVTGRRVSTPT